MSTALDTSGLTPEQVGLVEQFVRTLRGRNLGVGRQDLLRRWDERTASLPPLPEAEVDEMVEEAVREVRSKR